MENVRDIIIKYLKDNSFMDDDTVLENSDSLTENGIIDSIGLLELLDYISEQFSIEIPEDMLTPENVDSLEGLTNLVTNLVTE